MEALVLIFGEMIFALLAPLVTVVVDLIGAIITFLISLFTPRRRESQRSSGATNKIVVVLLVIAVVIVGALFVVNKFYFSESVRMVFGALERRAGIETECTDISGNVFSGQISLGACTVNRTGHPNSDFELQLNSVEFDLRVSSLLGTAEVESAHITGLRGSINKHRAPGEADDKADRPRRAFVIEDLRIEDVDINLSGINKDGGRFELPVQVTSATSAPLRSRLALFDILFRSDATGEVAGAEFEIETGGDASGRQTVWRADDVPVASFGAMTGGVLSWFHEGVVDVHVVDKWRRGGQLEIDMDWALGFRDIEVKAPETAGVITRIASGPIVAYVNAHGGDFPFEFQMVVNENQFEYKSSLAAAGLWTAVGESINNLMATFGVDVDDPASTTGEKLKEGAKSVLDRLRKPEQE